LAREDRQNFARQDVCVSRSAKKSKKESGEEEEGKVCAQVEVFFKRRFTRD